MRGGKELIALFILLTVFGLGMLLQPGVMWKLLESWKTDGHSEPSNLYIGSTRFGGALCTIAGIGGIVALLL